MERAGTSAGVPGVGGALVDGVAPDVATEADGALEVAAVVVAGAEWVQPASTTAPAMVRNCRRRMAPGSW